MLRKIISGMAVAAVVCIQAGAQQNEGGWRLGVGASYRDFKQVDFKTFNLRNFNNTNPAAGALGLQGYVTGVTLVPYIGPVTVDHASFRGASQGFDTPDKIAPVISLEKPWRQDERLQLSWVFNFQYYNLDCGYSTGDPAAFNSFNISHFSVGGAISPPVGVATPGLQAGTSVLLRQKFDLDLYVLDLGMKADYATKHCRLYAAAGPSLNLSMADSRRTESAAWNPVPGTADTGTYARSSSSSRDRLDIGAYIALGLGFDLNERWQLAAEYRYDLVNGNVGTSHAKLDLDGHSVQLRLSYSF